MAVPEYDRVMKKRAKKGVMEGFKELSLTNERLTAFQTGQDTMTRRRMGGSITILLKQAFDGEDKSKKILFKR